MYKPARLTPVGRECEATYASIILECVMQAVLFFIRERKYKSALRHAQGKLRQRNLHNSKNVWPIIVFLIKG